MTNVCVEEGMTDKHTLDGFRILARIIVRDFIANQALNEEREGDNDQRLYEAT